MKEFHVESKIVEVSQKDEVIFAFLSDFRNFDKFIPPDVEEWTSDADSCSFKAKGQKISLIFAGKDPYKTLKITTKDKTSYEFFFWIQLKATNELVTAIKLTVEADINLFLRGMLEKPLKQVLDKIADKLAAMDFKNTNEHRQDN